MKLEKLLNSLIQRGWKPFGEPVSLCVKADTESIDFIKNKGKYHYQYTLRELVGIESRLWQFVCKEGSMNYDPSAPLGYKLTEIKTDNELFIYPDEHYRYRLMLFSITENEDIEQFLLDNIKVDET